MAQTAIPIDLRCEYHQNPAAIGTRTPRFWSAASSSGEEAYSLAIILHDALAGQKPARRVQIFGSDLDEAALARAPAHLARRLSSPRSTDRVE